MPPWGLVYDIKRKCCDLTYTLGAAVGLVYDIKKDVPPGPPYPQVPPWGLVYGIKKDVFPPDPAYTFWCFGEERSVHLTLCVVIHRHVQAVIYRSVTFRWTMKVLIRCHAVRTSAGGWCHIVMAPHTSLSMSYSENECRWVVS